MFHKASTHIRPLLRLPSSASHVVPTPDHFTPNPSLLHHLPTNSSSASAGHLVVQGGSNASASAGSTSSAGRAGSGAGAGAGGAGTGAGGGYTGHARAFLSLPHTSADPSGSLSTTDDKKSSQSSPHKRSLLQQHKYTNRTRIVQIGEGVTEKRLIRQALEARAGSGRLGLVDIDEVEVDRSTLLSDRESLEHRDQINDLNSTTLVEAGSSRQSTPLLSPVPSHPSSPSIRAQRRLPRPRSSMELWQVGVAPSRPSLGLRAMSSTTLSTPLSELEESEIDTEIVPRAPRPSSRILSQPNRVLLDLAGLDIPSSRRISRRRYATEATTSGAVTDELVEYNTETTEDEADRRIYSALYHAGQDKRKTLLLRLIKHYRSPRSEQSIEPLDAELSTHLPLPAGYSVGTYNACLRALIDVRVNGESIAPILEIYNEMLERDVVPNGRTYVLIIQALSLREKDVWAADRQRADEKKWDIWRQKKLGIRHDSSLSFEKNSIVEGYKSEKNFESAIKLFRGVLAFHSQSTDPEKRDTYRFYPNVYNYMLDALASQQHPSVEEGVEIFRQAQSAEAAGVVGLYRHIFRILASNGDVEGLRKYWSEFEVLREQGGGQKLRDFKDVLPGMTITDRDQQIEIAQSRVFSNAIAAFIQVGEIDKGLAIFESMVDSLQQSGTSPVPTNLTGPPRASSESWGVVIVSLAEKGELDLAKQWYNQYCSSSFGDQFLRPMEMMRYIDALVSHNRWQEAYDLYLPFLEKAALESTDLRPDALRVKRIYMGLLSQAKEAENHDQAVEILSKATRLFEFRDAVVVPELAQAHVRILVKHGRYDLIPTALDLYGELRASKLTPELSSHLLRLLDECIRTEIGFQDVIAVLKAFARHRAGPSVGRQRIQHEVIEKYVAYHEELKVEGKRVELDLDGWKSLLGCFARTTGPSLDEGEYDTAFQYLMEDLAKAKEDGINLVDQEFIGNYIRHVAQRLFERFGSDRTDSLLRPIVGDEATEILAPFIHRNSPSELSSASETSYESSEGPITPITDFDSPGFAPGPQKTGKFAGPNLRIDYQLSRQLDSHRSPKSNLSPQSAYDQLKAGLSKNLVPHPESIANLIQYVARSLVDEPKVLELYDLAQQVLLLLKPELQPANWRLVEDSMIAAHCHLGNLEQAGLHRARLVENGMAPSAEAFATMIANTKDTTDDALVARELWAESQSMGVRPSLYLYNTIISKLSKARKAELALELFGQMKREGIKPSSVTYGAIINACCRVGDAESAETLFEEMSSQPNFRPRVPPYNTMMQFYLQTRPNRERVLYYFECLKRAKVPPSAHTYKLLLDAYATLPPAESHAMELVFNDLCHDRNVSVQGTHWASLITAYGISASDVPKALEVFDIIPIHPASRGQNAHSEPVVWEAILNVLATKGTIEQMESMHERMKNSQTKPTAYVYNVLISGYSRDGQFDKARKVFESMGDSITGVAAPNNHPQLMTSSGHFKPSTTTDIPTGIVYREPSTYECMIRSELQSGEGGKERAEMILKRMEERRYPVAVFMRARGLLDGQNSNLSSANGYDRAPVLFNPNGVESTTAVQEMMNGQVGNEGHQNQDQSKI